MRVTSVSFNLQCIIRLHEQFQNRSFLKIILLTKDADSFWDWMPFGSHRFLSNILMFDTK